MAKHSFWRDSMCRNKWLHRFEIKEQHENGVKEVCEICGKSVFFKLLDGKLNNYEYMSYHLRQALPPYHPNYAREYSKN